ncbi:hypothetical protein AB0J25_28875 [Streptomyces sp. NPDC049910]|uniref:hypothetical protein n=1 Tax=Streptomyces sp. NPDC049910 TaxID=3155278 RepID=UPI00341F9F7C
MEIPAWEESAPGLADSGRSQPSATDLHRPALIGTARALNGADRHSSTLIGPDRH